MDQVEPHTTRILGSVPAGSMKSAASRFSSGDVLYGRLRPYLNKVARPSFDGLASAEFIVLPGNDALDAGYLKWRLNAADFVNFASHLDEGDRPRVSFDQIGSFTIELPPLNEQRRIVAKIEELFSELDAGVESLKTAREQLKAYRQALLKHAFEGKLTAEWRAENAHRLGSADELLERIRAERRQRWEAQQLARYAAAGKTPPKGWRERYAEPAAPDLEDVPRIPGSWRWVSLDLLVTEIRGGTTEKPCAAVTSWPVLRSSSVRPGTVDLDDVSHLAEEQSAKESSFLSDGDVLFTRLSGSVEYVGNCVMVRSLGNRKIQFPDRLFRAKPVLQVLGALIEKAFASGYSRARIRRAAMSSAGHQRIAIGNLVGHPIPLPPLSEQEQIVAELESRLSIVEAFEQDIDQALKRAEALRQSILQRAFSGRLVPQDAADEPASALLERIRAERAAAGDGGAPRRRRRA